jgi:hypothetical protein
MEIHRLNGFLATALIFCTTHLVAFFEAAAPLLTGIVSFLSALSLLFLVLLNGHKVYLTFFSNERSEPV